MLQKIRNFFNENKAVPEEVKEFTPSEEQLATAVLIYHLISADGSVDAVELTKLQEILQSRYGIGKADLISMIDLARKKEQDAIDLYSYTSVLKSSHEYGDRLELMEILWEVAYADGIIDKFEDNIIWRVSELIGVSKRDRMDIRWKVAEKYGENSPTSKEKLLKI